MKIYQRGKCWYLDYSLGDVRIRKSVGRSRKAAERALAEVLAQKPAEVTAPPVKPVEPKQAAPSGMLFEKLCEEYLVYSRSNKAPQSFRRDQVSIKNLLHTFNRKPIREILPYDLEKYKNRRREKVKPATVNREITCLKHMFNKAVEWQFLEVNALRVVKKFKEPPGRLRWFTPEEAQRLIANCRRYMKPIVIALLHTGMRKGEALRLEWNDVDLTNRTLTVRNSKNNESRTIPINRVLFDTLLALKLKAKFKLVFCHYDGSPFHEIYYGFKAAAKRAGIEGVTVHTCRHTFASWLVMKGVDIRVIQVLMGHKTIAMTMRYAHLSQKTLQDAVDKICENTIQNDQIEPKSVPKVGTLLAQS